MAPSRAVTVLAVLIGGSVCVAIARADVTVLSPLCGLVAVGAIPAYAAMRWGRGAGEIDGLARGALAYAGVAVSGWAVWLVGLALGLWGAAALAAPVVMSVIVIATAGTAQDGPTSAVDTQRLRERRRAHIAVWLTAIATVGLVAIPFLPYGWERADGIHRMGMTDWYKHLMVATALGDSTFPPSNPFLASGGAAPYYYGFHLLAATLEHALGGRDSYPALLLLTLATAAAFPIVVFVVARGLLADARRAAFAATGATLLAGFDLVVWLLHAVRDVAAVWPLSLSAGGLRAAVPSTHLDFWIHHGDRQFNPPYISLIWAPQHVAAVLLALMALHLVWHNTRRERVGPHLLPAVMLAFVAALSAYVAIALAAGLLGCVAADSWRDRRAPWKGEAFLRWRMVGLLALAAALPVAWVLAGGPGERLTVAVSSAGSLLNGAVFTALIGDTTVARLLDSPALYLVEFGVVGLLGLAAIRRRASSGALSGAQREAVVIAATILVLVTLVRPPAGGPNNLYARPMLIVWTILACFAADAWCTDAGRRWWPRMGAAVGAGGILLGALGATAEGFAFWATPVDAVAAARWINANTPPGAVVAADPDRHNLGYWLRRRTAVADRRHALLFGATDGQYDRGLSSLREALAAAGPSDAARRLDALGADVVIVDSPPPPWMEAPCFHVGYRGTRVTVATRAPAGCEP